MIFNGINQVQKYGVVVLDKGLGTTDIENYFEWNENSLESIKLKDTKFTYNNLNPRLLIEGTDETDLDKKISNITTECSSGKLEYQDFGLRFDVELTNTDVKAINAVACELTLTYKVNCKYENETTVIHNNTTQFTINNNGNADVYCRVEITPSVSLIDLVVSGLTDKAFTIKKLEANKTIIIDRNSGITVDGNNKFNDIEGMWEFPTLNKGENHIKLSKSDISIKIIYKIKFI